MQSQHPSGYDGFSHVIAFGPLGCCTETQEAMKAVNTRNKRDRAMAEASKIAIIGVSGRYAKADNVGKLWEHLALGTDLTEDVSRWNLKKCFDDGQEPINCCPRGSFLSDIDRFEDRKSTR